MMLWAGLRLGEPAEALVPKVMHASLYLQVTVTWAEPKRSEAAMEQVRGRMGSACFVGPGAGHDGRAQGVCREARHGQAFASAEGACGSLPFCDDANCATPGMTWADLPTSCRRSRPSTWAT